MKIRNTAIAATAATALVLAGCTGGDAERTAETVTTAGEPTVLSSDDASAAAIASSQLTFAAASLAFIAAESDVAGLADNSAEARAPMLIADGGDALTAELDRLGVDTVVHTGEAPAGLPAGIETISVEPDAQTADMAIPDAPDMEPAAAALYLSEESAGSPAADAARANVSAGDGTVTDLPGGDPRLSSETIEAVRANEGTTAVAIGAEFGDAETFSARIETAMTSPELPGGGQVVFPGRRMVAAYGTPGTSSLGILGEQDVDASIERVQKLAEDYQPHSEEPVIPAFEIITTVASAGPGADGDYSAPIAIDTIRPWVDAAADAGVYVVLDLQPGRTDFLTQAKEYEELLREPHVGLALDPEWRLEDDQKHMAQIGSVTAAEINETADWLADLTRENALPQKLLILHQFSHAMISDREDVDATRDEVAVMVHADGHGTPELKTETWNALREGLPEGIWMAWKNFYDEDTPTLTPEQTFDVEPKPWFVSYQ